MKLKAIKLKDLIPLIAFFFLACNVLMYFGNAVFHIRNSVPMSGGGESLVVAFSRLVSRGEPIYSPKILTDYPFMSATYPPVYYYVNGLLFKIFGASNAAGRALSIASAVAGALFAGHLTLKRNKSTAGAVAASGLFLCMSPVFEWSVMTRSDTLGLALLMAGLWLYYRFEDAPAAYLLCAPFFILAFFTKLTMIGAGAALCLSLLPKARNRALLIGFITAAGCAGFFIAANYATRGGFYMHLVQYNLLPSNAARGFWIAKGILMKGPILLGFAFFAFLSFKGGWKDFECVYAAVALAIALCTISYAGSSINYYLELNAALALASGAFISRAGKAGGSLKAITYALLIAALSHNIFTQLHILKNEYLDGGAAKEAARQTYAAAAWIEKNIPPGAPVYYEDIQLPILMDRDIFFFSSEGFNYRLFTGLFKRDYLLDSIREKRWKAMALTGDYDRPSLKPIPYYPWLTAEQLKAIERNYRPELSFKRDQKMYSLFVLK